MYREIKRDIGSATRYSPGGIFACPQCKEKNRVYAPEDLQVNFGLIGVIRAFKGHTISLPKEHMPGSSGAQNELCEVHEKPIRHKCLKQGFHQGCQIKGIFLKGIFQIFSKQTNI